MSRKYFEQKKEKNIYGLWKNKNKHMTEKVLIYL